jgi:hypothetical protein
MADSRRSIGVLGVEDLFSNSNKKNDDTGSLILSPLRRQQQQQQPRHRVFLFFKAANG